jgi:hypothetical protein
MKKLEMSDTLFRDIVIYGNERNKRNLFFVIFSTFIYEIILFKSFSSENFGFGKYFYLSMLAWEWLYILAVISGLLLAYFEFKVQVCRKMIFKIHRAKI